MLTANTLGGEQRETERPHGDGHTRDQPHPLTVLGHAALPRCTGIVAPNEEFLHFRGHWCASGLPS